MLPLPAAGAGATGDTTMSSTQHQLIEQCATRLRGIVEALDNIHDTSPHRWSTDLDDVHSSAESLLALIKDQAPTQAAQGLAGAALAQPSPAQAEQATADDYEEVLADHRRLVRELDVLLNGEEGAAKQASLCDLVGQVSAIVRERRVPLLSRSQAEDAPVIGCLCGMPMTEGHHSPDGCSSLEEFAPHLSAQAQAKQAERPEVVGYRSKESGMVYEQDYGLKNPEALTTVAECERIVGALRADAQRWREQFDCMQLQRNHHRGRANAALARVAELEIRLRTAEFVAGEFAPVAQAGQVPDILTEDDMKWLRRFAECCEDSDAGGHDLPKAAVKQLVQIGALRHSGPDRQETTAFGDWLLDTTPVQGGFTNE